MNRIRRLARGWTSTTESALALWLKSLLTAIVFFGVFMVALPWPFHHFVPAPLPIPSAVRTWGGAALFCTGLAMWFATLDAFSRRGGGTPLPTDAPRHLVVDGLHGVVRNPMIVGQVLVVWGETLWFASAGFLIYAGLFMLFARRVVVALEEPELRERFGAEYEAYCARVPRWVPRLQTRSGPRG